MSPNFFSFKNRSDLAWAPIGSPQSLGSECRREAFALYSLNAVSSRAYGGSGDSILPTPSFGLCNSVNFSPLAQSLHQLRKDKGCLWAWVISAILSTSSFYRPLSGRVAGTSGSWFLSQDAEHLTGFFMFPQGRGQEAAYSCPGSCEIPKIKASLRLGVGGRGGFSSLQY